MATWGYQSKILCSWARGAVSQAVYDSAQRGVIGRLRSSHRHTLCSIHQSTNPQQLVWKLPWYPSARALQNILYFVFVQFVFCLVLTQWWPSLLMHTCVTRPRWVNWHCSNYTVGTLNDMGKWIIQTHSELYCYWDTSKHHKTVCIFKGNTAFCVANIIRYDEMSIICFDGNCKTWKK